MPSPRAGTPRPARPGPACRARRRRRSRQFRARQTMLKLPPQRDCGRSHQPGGYGGSGDLLGWPASTSGHHLTSIRLVDQRAHWSRRPQEGENAIVTSEQRAAMWRQARGDTVCAELAAAAREWPDRPAYSDRGSAGRNGAGPGWAERDWSTLTWRQTREQALQLAAGLVALGLQPGERVALMLPNRVEHVLADLATVHAGGVPVTFYPTLTAEQVAYQAADCDARIAVLDGAIELDR